MSAQKKRKVCRDLTFTFPCRSPPRVPRQRALLNLRYVGKMIQCKDENEVVTLGFDDTTKAAGVCVYDAKTTNITIKGDSGKRKSLTTSFAPNLSHSGLDHSEVIQFKLQSLALLAGDGTTVYDIKENIDFWMSDRAGKTDMAMKKSDLSPSSSPN